MFVIDDCKLISNENKMRTKKLLDKLKYAFVFYDLGLWLGSVGWVWLGLVGSVCGVRCVFDYFTMLSLEVECRRRESTYGGRVNPSEISYSPNDWADLPKLGYSPNGPLTKLIKPKCRNTSHM